ncbi:MAG: hypothetical protein AB7Q23_12875 [Hyphomonadaceae bacterium]
MALFVALLAACAAQHAVELSRLTNSEIHDAIDGHFVVIDHGPDHLLPSRMQREDFCNGLVRTTGDRIPVVVVPYVIGDDRLCIGNGESMSCRLLYRDGDGSLHMQWLRDGNATLPLLRVESGELPTEACSN